MVAGHSSVIWGVTAPIIAVAVVGCVPTKMDETAAAVTGSAYGLSGCWSRSEKRPDTPLGVSTLAYCFGPGGRGNYAAFDYDDGWETAFKYTAASDGRLKFIFGEDEFQKIYNCRFSVAQDILKVSGCEVSFTLKNECRDVVVDSDGYASCRRDEKKA